MKEIWSDNFGKNPEKGLEKWLINNVPKYKKGNVLKYIVGFAEFMQRPLKTDTIGFASNNFQKWTEFVKKHKINNP